MKIFTVSFNAIIESIDANTGEVIKSSRIHNLVVNDGLNMIRNFMAGDVPANPKAIAIGTDATAADNTDTELGAEVLRSVATISKPASYQVRYVKVFSVGTGVSHEIKEVGVFDSATVTGSTMLARLITSNTLDVDTNLSVTITYTIARV